MSGVAEQSNAEAQLTFSAKEAHSKEAVSKMAPKILSKKELIKSLADATNNSKDKNTKDWAINKLRFNAVGLLGHKNEFETLYACWNRMMQPEQQIKEVVMISGYSGTGKTTLAFELKKKTKEGAFVTGNFDQYNSGEPLSAILQAFGEICCLIVKKGPVVCKEIEDALREELKNEVYLLTQIIPDLKEPINQNTEHAKTSDDTTSEARQTSINYAFHVFVCALSSHFSPLVLCFDDLQWAGGSSLGIIELLLSDVKNTCSLMIIGCYCSCWS
eukprot:5955227-Ditylum_brightwellii.AAC.2